MGPFFHVSLDIDKLLRLQRRPFYVHALTYHTSVVHEVSSRDCVTGAEHRARQRTWQECVPRWRILNEHGAHTERKLWPWDDSCCASRICGCCQRCDSPPR